MKVGRAVASNTRGPGFESSHQQFKQVHLFSVRDENNEK